jgi:hypothetical protein
MGAVMQDDAKGAFLWLVRFCMITVGTWMTARGYGDAEFWTSMSTAGVALIGGVWSLVERQNALKAPPE